MATWHMWIDTGGTFTDCLALDPQGCMRRVKVLSSSALRASAQAIERGNPDSGAWTLRYRASFDLPEGFADGASLTRLAEPGRSWKVGRSGPGELVVEGEPGESWALGDAFELRFDEEAPILAARLATSASQTSKLPRLDLRLATTRGTNALLERRGARTILFLTRGFADLLVIGNQQRPDLFALRIERPEPLYARVVEVAARRSSDGEVLEALDLPALETQLGDAAREFDSAAVAFMHSDRQPEDEMALEAALRNRGLRYVSSSSALSPTEGYLARARTAMVDAYLQPVIGRYLERISAAIGDSRLRVMTSAGGLVGAKSYRAKDSLLSGPAGGVVGAAQAGRRLGFERLVAFDMGGTSTDVSRFDGDFEYRFEQQVGDASIAAPALAIETVAAGGGSICRLDGRQLKVGPESAGASPGPACYGAGGPLTITDVNLLLGRLDEQRFEIPIDRQAAEAALDEQLSNLGTLTADELLLGYSAIADQRMADAVRRISVRQGYDPRDYALVAFGGAGGQHACSVADLIGIRTVLLPADAGLLSAVGLGAALIERFATRQVLEPLRDSAARLPGLLAELADQALTELRAEDVDETEIRRRLVFLRLKGQESCLEVEWPATTEPTHAALESAFLDAYATRYGYRPGDAEIEVESLRVVVSERRRDLAAAEVAASCVASPIAARPVLFDGGRRQAAVYWSPDVPSGATAGAPALFFDQHASLTLLPGWRAEKRAGAIIARRPVS